MRRVWPLVLLCLVECSPMVSFEIRFSLPDGKTIEATKLHLRGRSRCARGSVDEYESKPAATPPEPGLEEPFDGKAQDKFDPMRDPADPAHAQGRFRASTCEVALTAWYDANGDQLVNAGDFVGRYPTSTIKSHFACSSTANHFGTLPLAPYQP
jgi:hypothetical protein